jgi:hypothetical protein
MKYVRAVTLLLVSGCASIPQMEPAGVVIAKRDQLFAEVGAAFTGVQQACKDAEFPALCQEAGKRWIETIEQFPYKAEYKTGVALSFKANNWEPLFSYMKTIVMKEQAYRNRILAEENAANVSMQRQLQANRDLNSALLGAALIFNLTQYPR